MNARLSVLALFSACFLWSCSAPDGFRALPSTATPPEPGTVVASLTIKVPLHLAARPDFVSPSTRSAELAIKAAAGCHGCSAPMKLDLGLTARSKHCTDNAAGITCTISVKLKPGAYDGSLSTYDGLPGCQSAAVPCRTLSLKQKFPLRIAAGKVRVPKIVLSGVPHSVWYLDVDNSTVVDRGSALFGLVGPNAKGRIELYAYDVDGNLILGPGAPTFTAGVGGGFGASVTGNVMELTSGSVFVKVQEPLTIVAHSPGCAVSGANCTLNGKVEYDPLIAVAETTLNAVGIYASHRIQTPPYATVASGIHNPVAVAFDYVGHLFVANAGSGVAEYAAPYASGPIATYTVGLKAPAALATAPDGTLAVADATNDAVTVYKPPSTTPIASIATPAAPTAISFDGVNRLWIGISGQVNRFNPPYTGSPSTVLNGSNGVNQPASLAFDDSGGIYVADAGTGAVNLYESPYIGAAKDSVSYPNVTTVIVQGYAFACGKGNLDVLDIGSLGNAVTQPISDGGTQMCAVDQNGDLYDIDAVYGDISEFDPVDYTFYASMTEGISQPAAMTVFP